MTRLLLWLARRLGAEFTIRPNTKLIESAAEFVRHVDGAKEPWEWKHRQAIRAMMNRFPNEPIRNLNLAIEIAVQECSAGR